jgi:hypothetical protein
MTGAFCLHPVTKDEPTVIRYSGNFDSRFLVLNLDVAAHAAGDTIISIRTNGVEHKSWMVDGSQGLRRLSTALPSPDIDNLTIAIVAGGKQDWHFEHAFVDRIWFSRD